MPRKGYLASNIRKKKPESNDFAGFSNKNEGFYRKESHNCPKIIEFLYFKYNRTL
jgi:hypothetical protein